MTEPSAITRPVSVPSADASGAGAPPTEPIGGPRADPPAARAIEPGTVLSGRYLIERAIGSGGMSTVFSALDRHRMHGPAADAKVAVKVLNGNHPDDQGRVQRLIREFRYMQRLTHRGIVRVFDVDCDEGLWFITMELLQGEPLTDYLRRHEPTGLPAEEALRLLTECTDALVCAHDHGVIHGDLKPGNIFIDHRGAARLLDFGSVPEAGESGENDTRFLTPAYASPQMLQEQPADQRDDLYSLGCIAYELFGGEHPFAMKSSLEAQRDNVRLTWLRSIPARHFGVIARMLSWEREARPADGREFLDSLMAAQVRAKNVYSRDGRTQPIAPQADRTPHDDVDDRDSPEVPKPTVHTQSLSRPARTRDETREQLSRRFAEFAGVVPDDWESHIEPASPVHRHTHSQPSAPATSEPSEAARSRWSQAIPSDLLEPRARSQETRAETEAAPAEDDELSATVDTRGTETAAPRKRAPSWFGRLRGSDAKVSERVERSETARASSAMAKPATPRINLRSSSSVGWTALVSKLRTLRVRASSDIAPALSAKLVETAASSAPQVAVNWSPQLQWRDQQSVRWNDLQVVQAPTITAQVLFGALQVPAIVHDAPAPAKPVKSAISTAGLDARLSRAYKRAGQSLDALRVAARGGWRRASSFVTHWRGLRLSIGSLAPRPAKPGGSWWSRTSPRWREAAPAMAIAGIAVVAWGLFQVSDASRSTTTTSAEQEREAELRLQALANAPIEIMYPAIAAPSMPVLPSTAARVAVVPPAPGVISFQSALVRVSPGQRMAVVNLRRNESTNGSAPFSWRIAPGTAKPGVDYEPLQAQMARFNDGQAVRTLFIPLKPSDDSRPERRFKIVLTRTPGAPSFGDITETEVVIAGSG